MDQAHVLRASDWLTPAQAQASRDGWRYRASQPQKKREPRPGRVVAPRTDKDGDCCDILLRLAYRLFQGESVTSRYIREHFNVSRPTSHRYMLRLEIALPVEVSEVVMRKGAIPTRTLRLARRNRPHVVTETEIAA